MWLYTVRATRKTCIASKFFIRCWLRSGKHSTRPRHLLMAVLQHRLSQESLYRRARSSIDFRYGRGFRLPAVKKIRHYANELKGLADNSKVKYLGSWKMLVWLRHLQLKLSSYHTRIARGRENKRRKLLYSSRAVFICACCSIPSMTPLSSYITALPQSCILDFDAHNAYPRFSLLFRRQGSVRH